ncbi:hypothetical protein VUR80DRAFT_8559 [Thermomyces stellatus]
MLYFSDDLSGLENHMLETLGNLSERVERIEDAIAYLEKHFMDLCAGLRDISTKLDPIVPPWLQNTIAVKWSKRPQKRSGISRGVTKTVVFLDKIAAPFKVNPTNERLLARAMGAEMTLGEVTLERDKLKDQRDQLEIALREIRDKLREATGNQDTMIERLNRPTAKCGEEQESAPGRERQLQSMLAEVKRKQQEDKGRLKNVVVADEEENVEDKNEEKTTNKEEGGKERTEEE